MVCVDILKQYHPEQQGKVYMKQDRYLKKRVLYLDGNMNTVAQLTIPVNLRQNYLHFQIQVPSTGVFIISINYQNKGLNFKVSISNLFKQVSYPHENQINQPCEGLPNWGTIVVDLKSFYSFTEITQLNISGNIAVKNIYNSNEEQLLPTDCQLNSVHRVLIKHVKPKLAPLKGILKAKGKKQEQAPLEEIPLPQERVSPMKQDIREPIIEQQQEVEIKSKPQSIMKLKHIHGYTPKHQANVIFLDDNYFAFPCDKTIVIMSEKEQKFCSATSEIQSITKYKNELIAACDSEILTFDYTTCSKLNHYKLEGYKAKFIQNLDDTLIVLASDDKHQMLLLIRNETIVIKQASPFHISTFKIQDKDNFISVGKENIRYWHIKDACLQGHSPYLGQYARETDFTDVLIQDKRILGCCKRGRVFQFIEKELTGVWQISESPITTMNKFTSHVVTTHKDGIKLWKQDFSELVREIKCEVEVIGCDSRQKLVCAFRDKSIGIVDDKTIKYLVHSHQQNVLDLIIVQDKIVSSAMDHEIKIWNKNLSLEYQFRCLDGLASSLCGLQTKPQFIAGFDNGYIRVFELQTYTVILEIDTKHPILALSGNSNDTLFLITHENETLILNNKLLIIKQHQHQIKYNQNNQQIAFNGFFNEYYYIASSSHIKLYSSDHLTEKYHLNIPISSIDCNDEHLHIVSNGNIKRFDKQLNFLQELISNSVYIKSCNNYVFNANNKDQLVVYDYLFTSDETGNPIKQVYQQKVKKLVISSQIISFVDDFIFIWDTNGLHQTMLTHPIDKPYINQLIDVIQESMSPHKQKLEKEKTIKQGKENKKINQQKQQSNQQQQQTQQQQTQQQQISPKQSPKANIPNQHLNIQNQNKQLIIDEQQLPKLKIKKVIGYKFSDVYIQQFPWNKEEQFYVLPSEQFISINYYTQHKQQLILTTQIQAIHYSIKGIIVLLKQQVLVFDLKMDLIKQFDFAGQLVCSTVSPCGNYLLMINENRIQIYILSSGKILTQTIIQYGNGNIYTDWCHDQDLMFVTLSGIQNQLWRVNQKALLEYCDLDIQPTYYQSSGFYKQSLVVSQGQKIHHIDIKQARTLLTIENATSQDITQVICTKDYVLLFTNSPNIYIYTYQFNDKHIISLDSIPLGYSNIFQQDIIVATRSQIWFVDIHSRTTVKIEPNIPLEHKILCTHQDILGTSEGTIMINNDEILVPKRQCQQISYYKNCIIAGYSDGYCRIFKDFQLIGQIQVGKSVSALVANSKNYFLVGNEQGQLYYCTGLNEIKMHEIVKERGDFAIISIDIKDKLIAYSTGNQKVSILHYKEKEEFIIKKATNVIDDTPEYYLMDSYRFRSIEQCQIQFSKTNQEQIIMMCSQIVIRNYIEHLNIITIECNGISFMQFNQYLIVGRKDGTVSMYDNEIELDKVQISQFPIHMMQNDKIAYGNMISELIQ